MSILGRLFGADDAQAQNDALDAKLKALNDKDYGPGGRIYDNIQAQQGTAAADQAYQIVQQHDAASAAGTANIDGQISDAFTQSLYDTADGFAGAVDGGVWVSIKTAFKLIPVSAWLALAVFGFFWFGGGLWLQKVLAKRG